jgi:selenocysteine lyase/cysteine desulfurase
LGEYSLASGAAGLFEVSTPAWGALAIVSASLDVIHALGVGAIARRRLTLIERLRAGLAGTGLVPLTPPIPDSPILAYAARDAAERFGRALQEAGITISVYPHRIRISPSIFNSGDDVDRLIEALRRETL